MKTAIMFLIVAALLIFPKGVSAGIVQISQSDFGPNTFHETFSEPIDSNNAAKCPIEQNEGSMVLIGTSASYTFSNTGVTFASPVPNTFADWHPEITVIGGNQYYNFGAYGEIEAFTNSIPGGTNAKFLLQLGSSSNHFSPFVLTFPGNGATKVGGDFIMSGDTPGTDKIVLTAYGASGNLLGTAYIGACNTSDWANNFYGIQSSDGTLIKSIGIDYSANNNAGNPGIANLMFEVPEPCTLTLLAGLFGLHLLRKTKFTGIGHL